MDTRGRIVSFLVALALVAIALWAIAIGSLGAACPAKGSFSCLALVRPSLASLGPVPIGPFFLLGALAQALAALLLLVRGVKKPFARDVSLLAAAGAGFALGLQPLSLLVTGRACLVCLLALSAQLVLAASLVRLAGTRLRLALAFFLGVLVVTGVFAWRQGVETAREDESRRAALGRVERKGARLVLLERAGCPYCEALRLDFLGTPEVLARLEKTGLESASPEPGEAVPVLLARDRDGKIAARVPGYPGDYTAVLAAAER